MKTLLLIFLSIILFSCRTTGPDKIDSGKVTDANISAPKKIVELEGTFESKLGVMEEISCYCFACGYLTLANNEKVALCFDELKTVPQLKNAKIAVKGYYKTITRKEDNQSLCPEGKMELFMVSKYTWK